ncbi:myosin heavy chain, skeletal muscle isoform X3 [Ochlerotatus camptorhynchus]|uniref:myosin heavy chain, skeletal muscle isoform X3 n=1 Tax=Ochlerotatus camptorhynchus TaxID=644619 RepID=UPI0031DED7EB
MRRSNIIPASPTSSTADHQRQVPDPTPTKNAVAVSSSNALPVSKLGCTPETTEKQLTKHASSPTLSSSTSSITSKQVVSASEAQIEKKITKRPPLAVKKISLLSDSISKFEQKSDETKPKVSWKSFLKQSSSKDKVTKSSTKSIDVQKISAKDTDDNNNEIKLQTRVKVPPHKITEEIISINNNQISSMKPEPTINNLIGSINNSTKEKSNANILSKSTTKLNTEMKTEIDLASTSALPPKGFEHKLELPSAKHNLTENHRSASPDCTIRLEIKTPLSEEHACVTTSNPPVTVKKVVRRVVKKIVKKSSSNLAIHDGISEEKAKRIVKKKITKSEPDNSSSTDKKATDKSNSTTITQINGNYVSTNTKSLIKEIKKSESLLDVNKTRGSMISTGDLKLENSTSDNIKYSRTPESSKIQFDYDSHRSNLPTLPDKHVFSVLSENGNNKPYIRSILPARSKTIDLGKAIEAFDKLLPTCSAIQNCETEGAMESTTLKERVHSWGKLDKLPLSRDSTMGDMSSTRSSSSSYDSRQSSRSVTPRHMFPHSNDEMNFSLHSDYSLPNRRSVSVRHRASSVSSEKSDYLSSKIEHFLKRTDHAMQEWRKTGKKIKEFDILDDLCGTYRSKSVSKIMSRGLQLLKDQPSLSRSCSRMSSVSRDTFDDCFDDDDNQTVVDDTELSGMTAELAEEHSSSSLISERLEAETTERLRLDKEVKEHEANYRNLQESSEKLEMELLCAKSDLNGDLDDDLDGDETGSNVYRLKYERVARELEFTKKRLQTQHEHDLEQLIGLKKQLEKKLADAYEEVEEQRQVVGQWKRKAQKMTNEMNDLRMLLEEQNSRNNLLEKRQRKFDSECQALQDSARQEKQSRERLSREKDVLIAEKFTIEQTLSDVRLELELKEEKYSTLQRELEEMTFGGGTEEEIAQLKRQKMELDRRCKEQEEELDEMAGQMQLLEQAKLRLEMSLETMRKEARKEAQQRDDEFEEVRGSAYKKIKSLECQLEQEHEERTLLLREKHELERRLNNLEENVRVERVAEEAASHKLKRDLRKYKALLRDAQTQLERAKTDSAGKTLIRQLRNQLEDAESARTSAVKARQVAENELQDVQLMLEEAQRTRIDAVEKATSALRDRSELQAQLDENEEEMAELMKKFSVTVKQLSSEQAIIADYELRILELESERTSLKEQISDLTARLENVENIGDSPSSIQIKRLELRTKELESRLEFEQATRARMEIQLNRHKDSLEKAQSEVVQIRSKEMHAQDALKKSQRTIRELREEIHSFANKEQENLSKRKDLEKRLETVEAECASARADLRLALQRISDLQQAMEEGDSYHSDSENSDSSIDSVSDLNYRNPNNISFHRERYDGISTNAIGSNLCNLGENENIPRVTLTSSSMTSMPSVKEYSESNRVTNGDENGESSYA